MKRKSTYYSFKVWITTLLVSPILLFIFFVCINRPPIERLGDAISIIPVYFIVVVFTMFVSTVGWFIFWGMEWLAYNCVQNIMTIKSLLFIGVQLIIIGTIAGLMFGIGEPAFFDLSIFYIAIPYGIVAGFSVWYYQLEPGSAPSAEPPYEDLAPAEQV